MTTVTRESTIRPGLFGDGCAADGRRSEFDSGNESLMMAGVRPDYLFIGDSITHLWELQAYFGGMGNVVINRGICGDVSTIVRRRFEADALQLHPGVIAMMIGVNDLCWELAELREDLPPMVVENITAMTETALATGSRMAVCSILPIWGPTWCEDAEYSARKNAQIVWINERLYKMAQRTDAIYVDYHSHLLAPDGGMRQGLADDGVHPNSAGYTIMARILRETLAEHGLVI